MYMEKWVKTDPVNYLAYCFLRYVWVGIVNSHSSQIYVGIVNSHSSQIYVGIVNSHSSQVYVGIVNSHSSQVGYSEILVQTYSI